MRRITPVRYDRRPSRFGGTIGPDRQRRAQRPSLQPQHHRRDDRRGRVLDGHAVYHEVEALEVGLYNSCLQDFFWNDRRDGQHLLQLRFHPVS